MLFSIVSIPTYIPTYCVGGFPSCRTFPSIYCLWIFFMKTILAEMKCRFDLHCSND